MGATDLNYVSQLRLSSMAYSSMKVSYEVLVLDKGVAVLSPKVRATALEAACLFVPVAWDSRGFGLIIKRGSRGRGVERGDVREESP